MYEHKNFAFVLEYDEDDEDDKQRQKKSKSSKVDLKNTSKITYF